MVWCVGEWVGCWRFVVGGLVVGNWLLIVAGWSFGFSVGVEVGVVGVGVIFSCWLLVLMAFLLLVVGCQLSVVGCSLLVGC